MTHQSSTFLTISLEGSPSSGDPLDAPGSTKRHMIEAADRLLDSAIAKMPSYLSDLPTAIRPNANDLLASLRRDYRILGPVVEVDVSMSSKELPRAWLDSLASASIGPSKTPLAIVLTTRLMGWWFGVGAADQKKIMQEARDATAKTSRQRIANELCRGIMQLTGAVLETELVNSSKNLMAKGPMRSITIRRAG